MTGDPGKALQEKRPEYKLKAQFIVDPSDGGILECNRAARHLFGSIKKSLLEMTFFQLFTDTPHGLPKARKIFEDFKSGKTIRNVALQIRLNGGEVSWVSLSADRQENPTGEAENALAMLELWVWQPEKITGHQKQADAGQPPDRRLADLMAENLRLKQQLESCGRTEAAFSPNAETLQTLLDATGHLVILLEADGTVITANQHACARYDKTLQEFRGLNIFALMDPDLEKARKKLVDEAIRSKRPMSGREEIQGKFFDYVVVPIPDPEGVVHKYAVAVKAVENNEARYRLLIEKMNDGLAVQDIKGRWTYVNDRFCNMIGYSRKELVGHSAIKFLDEADCKIFKRQMARRKKGGRDAYEIRWLHKGGRHICTFVSPQLLFDEYGDHTGSFAVITDITSLKKAEAALRESEKNFKKIAENTSDGILLLEKDGKTVYANSGCEKLTGFSVAEILREGITNKVFSPVLREIHLAKLRKRLVDEPVPNRYETEIITRDGRSLPIEITAAKTLWHRRSVVLLIVRDITSQKQRENRLVEEQTKLEKLVRERTKELVEANNALLVLARNIDKKRGKVRQNAGKIVNSKIIPLIDKFQKAETSPNHRLEYDILKAYLNELLTDPKDESGIAFALSNTELRIATMIRNGLTTPQMARLLSVSSDTVKTHRKNIRRKLNIRNSRVNLASYLRARLK